eukprot:2062208-Rhodomonas_salina.2
MDSNGSSTPHPFLTCPPSHLHNPSFVLTGPLSAMPTFVLAQGKFCTGFVLTGPCGTAPRYASTDHIIPYELSLHAVVQAQQVTEG